MAKSIFYIALLALASIQAALTPDEERILDLVNPIANLLFINPSIVPLIAVGISTAIDLTEFSLRTSSRLPIFDESSEVSSSMNARKLGHIIEKLDVIGDKISNQALIHDLLEELDRISSEVDFYYHVYEYKFHPKNARRNVSYCSKDAKDFIEQFYVDNDLKSRLYSMENILIGDRHSKNLLQALDLNRDYEALMCSEDDSYQVRLLQIIHTVQKIELKALELAKFRYLVTVKTSQNAEEIGNAFVEFEHYVDMYLGRSERIQPAFMKAIKNAPREFWKCDPSNLSGGEFFMKLDPIFRTYVTREKRLRKLTKDESNEYVAEDFKSFIGECDRFEVAVDVASKKKGATSEIPAYCGGIVHDCRGSSSNAYVCFESLKGKSKYASIRFEDGSHWGNKEPCKNYTEFTRQYTLRGVDDVCICTCDENPDEAAARYFSTLECVSDFHENKVITGVQLIKRGLFIHFRIEQAVLDVNANIKNETLEWKENCSNKPDVNFGEKGNFYNVTWDNRAINLDQLECPLGTVVTGVKFGNDENSLRLELRCTPFNFSSGRLNNSDHRLQSISGARPYRAIDNHLPTKSGNIRVLSEIDSSIKFTRSNNEEDIGSKVVPYIDTQKVSVKHKTPLAGISLVHRSSELSSGFLALKISTLDYSLYLDPTFGKTLKETLHKCLEAFKSVSDHRCTSTMDNTTFSNHLNGPSLD
ncbi:hypothetical protein QAD02_016711 [Eretmocerus hayati]|uniref:Uncharacterized protein n=1 Tax=Eretmocerus hayati TaxID=131215 RepID=A0ACC2PCB7_9HYME|nr:hypothetical protein QAD02_016711 [Eretmocerus hayati]